MKTMENEYITDFVQIDPLDSRQFKLLDKAPEGSYKVLDNFLPEKEFEEYSVLLDGSVDMRYNPHVSNGQKTTTDGFYFYHRLYEATVPQSHLYETLC
jgi:hypothetical protein